MNKFIFVAIFLISSAAGTVFRRQPFPGNTNQDPKAYCDNLHRVNQFGPGIPPFLGGGSPIPGFPGGYPPGFPVGYPGAYPGYPGFPGFFGSQDQAPPFGSNVPQVNPVPPVPPPPPPPPPVQPQVPTGNVSGNPNPPPPIVPVPVPQPQPLPLPQPQPSPTVYYQSLASSGCCQLCIKGQYSTYYATDGQCQCIRTGLVDYTPPTPEDKYCNNFCASKGLSYMKGACQCSRNQNIPMRDMPFGG